MKTLREIDFEIEEEDELRKRNQGVAIDKLLELTQEQAVKEEVAYRLGYEDWYDWFVMKIEKFGGSINWDGAHE